MFVVGFVLHDTFCFKFFHCKIDVLDYFSLFAESSQKKTLMERLFGTSHAHEGILYLNCDLIHQFFPADL